jgi:hypothetical protein
VPDLRVELLLQLLQELLLLEQAVLALLLRLLLELLPGYFVGESKSNCSESDSPKFSLAQRLCRQS